VFLGTTVSLLRYCLETGTKILVKVKKQKENRKNKKRDQIEAKISTFHQDGNFGFWATCQLIYSHHYNPAVIHELLPLQNLSIQFTCTFRGF